MAGDDGEPELLWSPSQRHGKASMDDYRKHVNELFGYVHRNTSDLQKWSIEHPHDFWIDLYTYLDIAPPLPTTTEKAYDDTVPMSHIVPFFPGLEINYAENVMFSNPDLDSPALIGITEGQNIHEDEHIITWREFQERVRETASALKQSGIKKGIELVL